MKPSIIKTDLIMAIGGLRHAMSLIAIWPKQSQSLKMSIIWLGYLTGFFICISASFAGAIVIDRDFERLIAGLGQTIPITVITVKYGLIKRQLKSLKHILITMEKDWENRKLFSTMDEDGSRRNSIMLTHVGMSRIFFNIYTSVVMICWILFAVTPATKRMTATNWTTTNDEFPLSSWYPLATSHLSPTYEIIYVFEVVMGVAMVIAHTSIDGLLVTCIFHLCGQFEILRCSIEEFKTKDRSSKTMIADIEFIVKRHMEVINTACRMEESFNHILLGQLLAGTLSICLAGFSFLQAMESSNLTALVRFGFLLIVALQQMFIYSLAGDYLTSQGAMIRLAAYKANWYELPPSVGKLFLLIMIRASRSVTITAGKFFPMSLTSFTKLLKSALSYLSVIRAMNTDNLK